MNDLIPNIRHLAAFAATVEHGSVTRAAEAVNLTQPALTQAIAGLERELDCQLFEREPTGMRPTQPAILLAPRVKSAIEKIGSSRATATQLRAFLALARAGSYASAAETTGLSPASLHRAVADLSYAVGERLVERRGRHLTLTRKGEARARRLGLAIADLRSGFAEVAAWLGKAGGRIVIGAMPLSRARWLPRAILRFRAQFPSIDLAVVEGSHAELAHPLRNGEIDFLLGALRSEEELDDLEQEPIFEDRPQIIMRAGHALSRGTTLTAAQLTQYQWIMPSSLTPLRSYWEEMLAYAGCSPPRVAIECGSVLTIREILLETDMLTLLSPDQLRVEIEAGLLTVLKPPAPVKRMIGITTRRDWHPTAQQRAILTILRETAPQVS